MKRPTTLFMFVMMLGTILVPTQSASAQNGPDICAAAANGEPVRGYEVVYGRGGSGHQVVLGDDGDNDLRGGSGNDVLCGFGGDDILRGNSGNDILVGGDGDDTLRGGSGNDEEIQEGGSSGGGGGGGGFDCSGFENLAPANNPSLSFQSVDDCLAYAQNVGDPVAHNPDAPQVFIFDRNDGDDGDCEVGVGLFRFPAGQTFSVTITDSNGNAITDSPFSVGTNGDGDSNPLNVVTSVLPGVYTASATTGGQTYSYTRAMPTAGSC